jgi:AcrR family transcriptional regulator
MGERTRGAGSRPYVMRKRAEQVDQTRQRITEAAARLHTSVGPAATTISALAEAAGVTRLTVYRHFPDEAELFAACRGYWVAQHPPPDVAPWRAILPLEVRARGALGELYGWYARHGDALHPIYRDFESIPAAVQERMHADDAAVADALLDGLSATPPLRAAAGHLVAFATWRSLTSGQGLSCEDAVDLAVRFLSSAAAG